MAAERYAGRTVGVDSAGIRFSHGDGTAEVLPIEWIEEVKDPRPHIRILNLHVRDGDVASTIRLIASAQDSSFRLQTMPDVAWRRLSDREARAARMAVKEPTARDTNAPIAPAPVVAAAVVPIAPPVADSADIVPADTVIGATRFTDRDLVAQEELSHVVASCKRFGCRIGIHGLTPARFGAFATFLKGLGAQPFHRYLIALRLEKARELIVTQHLPVSVVAKAVGFSGLAHFSRAFTQRFGANPSEIRKGVHIR